MSETTVTAPAIVQGAIVDAAVGRARVVHVYPNGKLRLHFGDGSVSDDYTPEIVDVVSVPGDRDHQLQLAMCGFREWSTEWDRVNHDEPHSRRAWDDVYDTGIDLLRDFAKASGVILESDSELRCLFCRTTVRIDPAGVWRDAKDAADCPASAGDHEVTRA